MPKLLPIYIALFLLASSFSTLARASWGFTATLSSSGCNAPSPGLPPISGMPTKGMCESVRSQVVAIRACAPMYPSGTCCVFYTVSACSGSDDATAGAGSAGGFPSLSDSASGTAFFTKNKNTEYQDWQNDTLAKLERLGKDPSLASAFDGAKLDYSAWAAVARSGDQDVDDWYGKEMASYDGDTSVVNLSGDGELKESDFFYKLQGRKTGARGADILPEEKYRAKLATAKVESEEWSRSSSSDLKEADSEAAKAKGIEGLAGEIHGDLIKGAAGYSKDKILDIAKDQGADALVKAAGLNIEGGTLLGVIDVATGVVKWMKGDKEGAGVAGLDAGTGFIAGAVGGIGPGMAVAGGKVVGGVAKKVLIGAFQQLEGVVVPQGWSENTYNNVVAGMTGPQRTIAKWIGMGASE